MVNESYQMPLYRLKLPAVVLAAGLLISGCSKSSKAPRPIDCGTHTTIGPAIQQDILKGNPPVSFLKPLKSSFISTAEFGLPTAATTTELQSEQKVIKRILKLMNHPEGTSIAVIEGRTPDIPQGELGVAIYPIGCKQPKIIPTAPV